MLHCVVKGWVTDRLCLNAMLLPCDMQGILAGQACYDGPSIGCLNSRLGTAAVRQAASCVEAVIAEDRDTACRPLPDLAGLPSISPG